MKVRPSNFDDDWHPEYNVPVVSCIVRYFVVAMTCRHYISARRGRKSRFCRKKLGISMLSLMHSPRRYNYFRFRRPYRYFRLSATLGRYRNYLATLFRALQPQVCRWNFDDINHTLGDDCVPVT